jgi:hypothetical protein
MVSKQKFTGMQWIRRLWNEEKLYWNSGNNLWSYIPECNVKLKNKMKNKKYKKGTMALSQIIILVLGIVAVSYAIGSEVKTVDATVNIPTSLLPSNPSWDVYTLTHPPIMSVPTSAVTPSTWIDVPSLTSHLGGIGEVPASQGAAAPSAGFDLFKYMGNNIASGIGSIVGNFIIAAALWAAFYFIPSWLGSENAAEWQAASFYIGGGYALVSILSVVFGAGSSSIFLLIKKKQLKLYFSAASHGFLFQEEMTALNADRMAGLTALNMHVKV